MSSVRRTSLNLDFDLVERARKELGTRGTTETVRRALEEVVRRAAVERLLEVRFDHLEPDWLEQVRQSEHLPPEP
jgi:Arc/MetJ family transcription regulator